MCKDLFDLVVNWNIRDENFNQVDFYKFLNEIPNS